MITITNLRTNHRRDPLGVPGYPPRLSWELHGEGHPGDVRFEVAIGSDRTSVWEDSTSRIEGLSVPRVRLDETQLGSRDEMFWAVRAHLGDGADVTSDISRFEIGLLEPEDWRASWVTSPLREHRRDTWDPAPLFRKTFDVDDEPERARVYVTALGVYRLWLNGEELTASALLRPGWTDYRVRVYHQTFDVTGLLRNGTNVVAAELGRGWYAGRLGLQREPGFYGGQAALMLQLEARIAYRTVEVSTDDTWKWSHGAILSSDLLQGEIQDIRQHPSGWTQHPYDDSSWEPAQLIDPDVRVDPQPHDSATVHSVREGRLVWEHARGPAVYDFGQNLVGWTRLTTRTLAKSDVIVRHGEILTPHNLVYRDNLRGAFQEDRYTTGDADVHILEPRHTLHGFRYAEVWGLPSKVPDMPLEVLDDTGIEAVVVDAGMEPVGTFESSDDRLNQLSSAVEWTIRDNFIEVITDCPQRDERLGWLGDAGVISRTSAYYFDVAAFVSKFIQDAADAQTDDGTVRSYVPPVPPGTHMDGAPGWADGYVRLVHLLGARYGDVATVQRHYDSLRKYLRRVDADNPSGIRTEGVGANYGDWLSLAEDPDEPFHPLHAYTWARSTSPRQVVATAHTHRSYVQLAEMAEWLDDEDEAARCRSRADEIRRAYVAKFVADDGTIEGDTQTVYAQALGYELVTGALADKVAGRLIEKVEEIGHVTTGIHGTEHILPVLVRYGRTDLAYRLLLREEMPSWLHMVTQGATTIWEKWDGLASDGTLSTVEMNSFNHCALGAVGQFLFEDVGGIDLSTTTWDRTVNLRPAYSRSLDWARATYSSPMGPVSSYWRWEGDRVIHEFSLPPLARAQLTVPTGFTLVDGNHDLGPGLHQVQLVES